jgi:hypothetical protein
MPPEDSSVAPPAAASFASGESASAFAGIPWFLPGPLAITRRGVWLVLWGVVLTFAWLVISGVMLDPFRPEGLGTGPEPNNKTSIQASLPYRVVLPYLRIIALFGAVLLTAAPRELRADRLGVGMVALLLADFAIRVEIDQRYTPWFTDSEPTLVWITVGQALLLASWGAQVAFRRASRGPAYGRRWRRIGVAMGLLAGAIPIAAVIYDSPPLYERFRPSWISVQSDTWIRGMGEALRIIGAIGIGLCLCGLVVTVRQLALALEDGGPRSETSPAFSAERPERIASIGLAIALTALLIHAGSRAIDCFRSLERARQYEDGKNAVPAMRLPPGVPGPEMPLPRIRSQPRLMTPPHAEPSGGA